MNHEEIWPDGAAYIDGKFMPVAEARLPITDWGYRRSDVTYDVASVWDGKFFRLDDHLKRFRRSMESLRMELPETEAELRSILHELVRRAGLTESYVAFDCLRGSPPPGARRHPIHSRCYLAAFAVPYVWLMPREVIESGVNLIIASTPRIPETSVDPRAKNFHWGDMTRALFEAHDKGADNPILLDHAGNVTEGPGFNVFAITDGRAVTPERGVLEGITRLAAIELCRDQDIPLEIRTMSLAELRQADEIFITSTAGGIMGVTRLDDRILGNGRPGPITERLQGLYWQRRKEGWCSEPVAGLPTAA